MGIVAGVGRGLLFTAGAFAGALTIMGALWLATPALRPSGSAMLLALAAASLALALRDSGLAPFKMPQRHHQVKRETLQNHPLYGVASFGFALGTAFWTFVSVSVPYVLFALVPILSPEQLVATSGAFAAGRGAPVVARMFLAIDEDRTVDVLLRGITIARTISAIALAFFGGILLRAGFGA